MKKGVVVGWWWWWVVGDSEVITVGDDGDATRTRHAFASDDHLQL